MRYQLLSVAIVGAATVSGMAIPNPNVEEDHSQENVCKVETVTVKLTTLDQFVGHTFDLLTPKAALQGVAESLNITLPNIEKPKDGKPELISFNPAAPFKPKPTGASSSGVASNSPSEGAPFPTTTEGGDKGGLGGFFPDLGDIPGAISSGIDKLASGMPKPTGMPGLGDLGDLIPGGNNGDDEDDDDLGSLISLIPGLGEGIDKFTGGADKPKTASGNEASATGTEASAAGETGTGSTGIIPSAASTGAPFPIPEISGTSGSNSTIPGATGSTASSTAVSTESASSAESASASVESTESASSSVASSTSASSTLSTSTLSSSSSSASASATGCASPEVRVEWRDMSAANKEGYARGVKCLMDAPSKGVTGAKSRWDDMSALHQQLVDSVHGSGLFLPWHRYFLHLHATLLKEECDYSGPIPWWDETKDAGRFVDSPVFESQYLGSARAKTDNGLGACVTDGILADVELNIGPGKSNSPHCLSRAVDESLSRELRSSFFASCNAHTTYSAMLNCAYPGPHAYGHNAVGAVMSDVASSPGDPVFYLHHGMVDRAWKLWQQQSEDHLMAIGGPTTPGGNVIATLQTTLTSMNVLPDIDIEKVMNTEGEYLCYTYSY